MIINGKVVRTGEDMRKAYDGVLKNDYEEKIPLSIFPEDDSLVVVEITGRVFPYLFKTINYDGSIEIDERYVFGMKIAPISGKIGRIVLYDQFYIAHSNLAMTTTGLAGVFGDCRVEVFYEKTPGEIPERTKYSMQIWDRRNGGSAYQSVILNQEKYEELKLEGLRIKEKMRARLDDVVSRALKEKNEQGLLSFIKKIKDIFK